mgnify:CR=1 FL=1
MWEALPFSAGSYTYFASCMASFAAFMMAVLLTVAPETVLTYIYQLSNLRLIFTAQIVYLSI